MDLFSVILCTTAGFLASWITYRYLTAEEDIWKQQGIHVAPWWRRITGVLEIFMFSSNDALLRDYKRYGKLSCRYFFGSFSLFVAHPDMVREILVKNFHNFANRLDVESGDPIIDNLVSVLKVEKWKRMRSVITPTFSTGKIKKMTKIIVECAETLRGNFSKFTELNEPADIKKLICAFTMDTIASTAFSTKVDSLNDPNNPFVVSANQFFSKRTQWKAIATLMLSKVAKRLHINVNSQCLRFFQDTAMGMIEERRKHKEGTQARTDFLQLLMNASKESKQASTTSNANDEDDETDTINDKINGKISETKSEDNKKVDEKNYEGLSDHEIIAQCVIFFLGGFETVASTIALTVYELALCEEYQERLIAEIDEVLQNKNEISYEDILEMKYLDCVVSETLRKYTPGVFIRRIATVDCTMGDGKIKIPKDTVITIPACAMHHDPEYYPEPDKYKPERFSPEEKASRDPYVYLPFGVGPRNCVATRFALMEAKLCLAHLFRYLRFHRCSATMVPLKFEIGQPNMIAKNIFLSVEKRKDVIA